MYEVKFESVRVKRDFKKLLKKLSKEVKKRLRDTLEKNPYPSKTHGTILNKVTRKRDVYCYPVTGGDRALYLIFEKPKQYIEILFAGNDKDQIRFLKERG